MCGSEIDSDAFITKLSVSASQIFQVQTNSLGCISENKTTQCISNLRETCVLNQNRWHGYLCIFLLAAHLWEKDLIMPETFLVIQLNQDTHSKTFIYHNELYIEFLLCTEPPPHNPRISFFASSLHDGTIIISHRLKNNNTITVQI